MHGAGTQTDKLIVAANINATAAISFATSTEQIRAKIDATEKDFETMADSSEKSIKTTQNSMRLDQRAWISLSFDQIQLRDGLPILVPTQIANTGKTPAKKLDGYIVVSLLKNTEQPQFVYTPGHARYRVAVGAILPNIPTKLNLLAARHGVEKPETILLDSVIHQEINSGQSLILVYGRLTFTDIFNREHWITFCRQASGMEFGASKECAQYNDIDNN